MADDLDEIKQAVDDAASVGGGLWLSYLFVLFYLAIAAGAVTHADLFLENPVKLPFLTDIELPLVAFFFLAPILFLIVHAYTLVHLVFLTEKAKRFHAALHDPARNVAAAKREALQWRLPSNIFIQFLAGPSDLRGGSFGWLLRAIGWVTLVIAPVLLLLMMQIQFLPFHNSWITWTQRVVLVLDFGLIWWLWRKILSGRELVVGRPWAKKGWRVTGAVLTALAVVFSWALATFPGERQTESLAAWRPIHERNENRDPIMVSVHDWLFESRIDYTSRHRRWPLSSTLVLTGFNIYEGLKIDDPDKVKGRDFVFHARGRDLRGAILDLASLPKVDFHGADLRGASLEEAQLQGASLFGAQVRDANLYRADLHDAFLQDTQLQGARLDSAQLQGASLDGAHLEHAWLESAELQGASLKQAQLQGAHLFGAKLQRGALDFADLERADLSHAQLQGASLDNADLYGASLNSANLQGARVRIAELSQADFRYARLQGASLNVSRLQVAWLQDAELQGASLERTQLQGAWLDGAQLQSASLVDSQLQGASLKESQLQGATLAGAELQGASMQKAVLRATDLSNALLWRSSGGDASTSDAAHVAAIAFPDSPDQWLPVLRDQNRRSRPWNRVAYEDLLKIIESFPQGTYRDEALERIRRLDCQNSDPTLASCDASGPPPPPEAGAWRTALEHASVDSNHYSEALAAELKALVCSGGNDAIYVLHGELFKFRLLATGVEGPALVGFIMGKDCPISASLTDEDRAALLRIKQAIEADEARQQSPASGPAYSP